MSDLRLASIADAEAVTFDLLRTPASLLDETQELSTAVIVALGTDRRALADDDLPNPDDDDRRGWWGDRDAETLWAGWPIGTRLWLLSRSKITGSRSRDGSTLARAETYVREALQPFIDAGIASRVEVEASRSALHTIKVATTIYRGPLPAISLTWQSLWNEIGE